MGEKILRLSKKVEGIIPELALFLAVQSVSSTYFVFLHQPDVPDDYFDNETLALVT